MRRRHWIFVCTTVTLLTAPVAEAWWEQQHRVVAAIAEQHLSDESRHAVGVLTEGRGLVDLANWADRIKSKPAWRHTKPWHYIEIGDQQRLETMVRDARGDILRALNRSERHLRDASKDRRSRWQALAFTVHFIADLHQPLHVGNGTDRGGNQVSVIWLGDGDTPLKTNLHSVWDGLLTAQKLPVEDYARALNRATSEQISAWQSTPTVEWARESKALRARAYAFGDNFIAGSLRNKLRSARLVASEGPPILGRDYADRTRPLAEQRLLMAGVRLAGQLNTIFALDRAEDAEPED